MNSDTKVELMQAFSWICETCGKRNFERAIKVEVSKEEEDRIKKELNIDKNDEGCLVRAPDVVICEYCNASFETTDDDCIERDTTP